MLTLLSVNLILCTFDENSSIKILENSSKLDTSCLLQQGNGSYSYDKLFDIVSQFKCKKGFLNDSQDIKIRAKISMLRKLLNNTFLNGEINFDEYDDEFIESQILFNSLIENKLFTEIKYAVFLLNDGKNVICKLMELDEFLTDYNNILRVLCVTLYDLHLQLTKSKSFKMRIWDDISFSLFRQLKENYSIANRKYLEFKGLFRNFKKLLKDQRNKNKISLRKKDRDFNTNESTLSKTSFIERVFMVSARKILKMIFIFKNNLDVKLKTIEKNFSKEYIEGMNFSETLEIFYDIESHCYTIKNFIRHLENEFDVGTEKYMLLLDDVSKKMFCYLLTEFKKLLKEIENILQQDSNLEILYKKHCILIDNNDFDISDFFNSKLNNEIKLNNQNKREELIKAVNDYFKMRKNQTEPPIKIEFTEKLQSLELLPDDFTCLSVLSLNISLESEAPLKGLRRLHKSIRRNCNMLSFDSGNLCYSLYPNLKESFIRIDKAFKEAKFDEIYFEYNDKLFAGERDKDYS
ncbi:hypothetical protein H312_00737 [Anncaliia algerae PRA339]|uniref:Uncharacterized protein n=1 Tax=Anncaliia algerae PRA339 TaxID=1288291 RepID=A0A059F3H5_9MICR|nr:hypothetical protein H312_00737 [Anncaliia algerae PRA339]